MPDVLTLARQIIKQEAAAIESVADQIDSRFLKALYRILSCKGNVIVCGIGKAGLVGQKLTATFASTGTPAHFLHPAEAIHGDLGRIGRNDVAVILSLSGETEEITRLLPAIKRTGIPIIAMTATELSTLGRNAEIVLPLGQITEASPLCLAPSSSTAAMLALGDALALTASERRRFRDSDFAVFHPGGALGRKLSAVDDYLRTLDKCRIAPQEETIREVFSRHRIQGRRSGAVLLTDKQQILTGIFTDSDLARLFEQRNEHLLDEPIQQVMTANPISVKQGTRMLDAVAVMGEKRISEVPVVDNAGHLVGLIDITDVVAAFPEMSGLDSSTDNEVPSIKFTFLKNLIRTA